MKKKPKPPHVPEERRETLRHDIISALEGRTLFAREISSETGTPERDVYEHLEHIQRTLNKKNGGFRS